MGRPFTRNMIWAWESWDVKMGGANILKRANMSKDMERLCCQPCEGGCLDIRVGIEATVRGGGGPVRRADS